MFVIVQSWNNMLAKEEEDESSMDKPPIIKKNKMMKDNDDGGVLNKAQREEAKFQERFGKCLRHSGVAITVTSLTDFMAFMVGASTVLPALKSFCIYCGVGILLVYFLQATWFVAWMAIDQVIIH